ncbi:hypothetical protein Tco_1240149 [Tanacetum coccineum]
MSKMLYTRFTKLINDYLLSHNKSIPCRSDSKLHSLQDDHPITKLLSTTNSEYKFGMEVPDAMISDAIKKKAGERGKGFMCYGDQVANVPNKLKKDVVPRKTRSLIIAEEAVVDETPANELTDFMSHPVYTDAQTTLVVHNPEGNPELTSKENSLSYNNSPTKLTSSQNKEADAKALEKGVQAKVLTEIKKLLPTHIPNAIANYVKPRLNTSMLEVMKTNKINLFTQSSTSTNDLLEMDLKLKLLKRIH